eukprot:756261-Hanusia_phi.AAC.1
MEKRTRKRQRLRSLPQTPATSRQGYLLLLPLPLLLLLHLLLLLLCLTASQHSVERANEVLKGLEASVEEVAGLVGQGKEVASEEGARGWSGGEEEEEEVVVGEELTAVGRVDEWRSVCRSAGLVLLVLVQPRDRVLPRHREDAGDFSLPSASSQRTTRPTSISPLASLPTSRAPPPPPPPPIRIAWATRGQLEVLLA